MHVFSIFLTFSNDACYPNFSGDAGDSLTYHDGSKFSTKDVDNDADDHYNIAERFQGAWWYYKGHKSNLNGKYHGGNHTSYADGVNWSHFKGFYYSLKTGEMKVRPSV